MHCLLKKKMQKGSNLCSINSANQTLKDAHLNSKVHLHRCHLFCLIRLLHRTMWACTDCTEEKSPSLTLPPHISPIVQQPTSRMHFLLQCTSNFDRLFGPIEVINLTWFTHLILQHITLQDHTVQHHYCILATLCDLSAHYLFMIHVFRC